MDTFAGRHAGQRQARALLEYLWTEIAANYWWSNQRVAGARPSATIAPLSILLGFRSVLKILSLIL